MATLGMVLPINPGQTDNFLKLAETVKGPRRDEYQDFLRRRDFKENWYLQQTPFGDVIVLYLETADIGRMLESVRDTQHPFEVWFFQQATAIHGVDFTKPPTGPLPEVILVNTEG
jgi:hypothetical protein